MAPESRNASISAEELALPFRAAIQQAREINGDFWTVAIPHAMADVFVDHSTRLFGDAFVLLLLEEKRLDILNRAMQRGGLRPAFGQTDAGGTGDN